MARFVNKLEEADLLFEAMTETTDPADREMFLRGALSAIETVMRDTADRIRRVRELQGGR